MSGSHLELLKMAATLYKEFDMQDIFEVFEVFNSFLVEGSYGLWRSITEYPWLPIVAPSNQSVSGW